MPTGILYVVATPIGNLDDITLRALSILRSVDVILCEDTRVTAKLLQHYQIQRSLLSYHQHSDRRKTKEIQALLEEGKNLALVTDAGTPGISDPGNVLVAHLIGNPQIQIIPIPGPSALITALSVSGLPTDKFLFLGFPPHKNKRQKFFKEVEQSSHTVVFYESGHRITRCLAELSALLHPNRQVVVCRELTKKFETIYRGTVAQLVAAAPDERGEFVVVVSPSAN